jgi:hypothetical protein
MSRSSTRLNFRCSEGLREKLEEAAKRSEVSLSEQARISLERLYGVKEESIWLPPILQNRKTAAR